MTGAVAVINCLFTPMLFTVMCLLRYRWKALGFEHLVIIILWIISMLKCGNKISTSKGKYIIFQIECLFLLCTSIFLSSLLNLRPFFNLTGKATLYTICWKSIKYCSDWNISKWSRVTYLLCCRNTIQKCARGEMGVRYRCFAVGELCVAELRLSTISATMVAYRYHYSRSLRIHDFTEKYQGTHHVKLEAQLITHFLAYQPSHLLATDLLSQVLWHALTFS